MGFFSKQPKSILGIDIGASAIKMVELSLHQGRPSLGTYGFAELEKDEEDTLRQKPDRAGAILKQLLSQSGATSRRVVASLPTFSVFSSVVHLPSVSKKEQDMAVRREIAKFIHQPIDEMLIHWEPLSLLPSGMQRAQIAHRETRITNDVTPSTTHIADAQDGMKGTHVLVTATEKKLVAEYTAMFTAAGLELIGLETEAFALGRSLVGHDTSIVLIVDIGAANTDIMVIDAGIPVLSRSIAFGGLQCTEALARVLGVDPRIAEQAKRDISGDGQSFGKLRTSGSIATTIAPVIQKTLTPLVNEVQYVRGLYPPPATGKHIEKIILTGGAAWMDNIISYLTERFNITCMIGDPWARVEVPVALKPALEELGPRLSIAVGLAMRELAV